MTLHESTVAPGHRTFTCEIQARFRDLNLGRHIDNVEAVRVIDEARIKFVLFAPVFDTGRGLLRHRPDGVTDLMGAQRVDYLREMAYELDSPFLVTLWICHIGRTSFTFATELRTSPDSLPALIAETTFVLWNQASGSSWPMTRELRADLEAFAGPSLPLRAR